jgi:hypothetical protein
LRPQRRRRRHANTPARGTRSIQGRRNRIPHCRIELVVVVVVAAAAAASISTSSTRTRTAADDGSLCGPQRSLRQPRVLAVHLLAAV